jgi:hypothetical protein
VEVANGRGELSITNFEEGIQFLRIDGNGPVDSDWGTLRVKLTPIQGNMYGRGGFYLHNSQKRYSHGCIEVGKTAAGVDFFTAMSRKPKLILRVKYSYPEQITRGNTGP